MTGATARPAGPRTVLVVGCGLIGASVGMALRAAGDLVLLADRDPAVARTAAALGAGTVWGAWPPSVGATADLPDDVAAVVVAVPPRVTAAVCLEARRLLPQSIVVHVSSVQAWPRAELEAHSGDIDHVVGTHPMAGSERGGPAAGSAVLFRDRPWVICADGSASSAAAEALDLVRRCGARPVAMTPVEHDAAVAVVSHVPQLVSSALAAELAGTSEEVVGVAGTGLRDLTRLAGADPSLWQEIATANAGPVAEGLRSVAATLSGVADALAGPPGSGGPAVRALIEDGRAGRARLGGKHGTAQRHWAAVRVSIEDRPGALVDVLLACRDLAVNVEDLSVEHAQGHPVGILELLVDPSAAGGLAAALGRRGWDVAGVSLPHD